LETVTVGVPDVPIPLSGAICMAPMALLELSVITIALVSERAVCGVNIAPTVQVVPKARAVSVLQVESRVKLVDGDTSPLMVSAALPSFSSVTVCAALLVLTAVLP
jgi:hypothetical protein